MQRVLVGIEQDENKAVTEKQDTTEKRKPTKKTNQEIKRAKVKINLFYLKLYRSTSISGGRQ